MRKLLVSVLAFAPLAAVWTLKLPGAHLFTAGSSDSWLSFYGLDLVERSAVIPLALAGLFAVHVSRQRLYLQFGNPRAQFWDGKFSASWMRLGPLVLVVSAGILVAILRSVVAGGGTAILTGERIAGVLLLAPINALAEEITFRCLPMFVVIPLIGANRAAILTSLVFGVYLLSLGPAGMVFAAIGGWLLARAMLDAHGLVWAWAIHTGWDLVAYSALAVR